MVSLGSKVPSWKLNRWGRDALRFSPITGDSYTLRGDKRTLHYSGERESHRFTILDGSHFEYDLILNREPEGNQVFVAIEGWEQFDFFRQPDSFGPEILRGSYAVYKKEMVINSPAYHVGTGKICHIHRPRIIDARGQKVWGDVWIENGVMTITIPERWLGEAQYPVVVDPVIGSNTVGAYYEYDYLSYDDWETCQEYYPGKTMDNVKRAMWIELYEEAAFNKYNTPVALNGTYDCYAYIHKAGKIMDGYDCTIAPFIYSNYGNRPKQLLSYQFTYGYPLPENHNYEYININRWIKSTITPNAIAANTDIWFGFYGNGVALQFDYGVPLFRAQELQLDPSYREYYSTVYEMLSDLMFLDIGIFNDKFNDPRSEYRNVLPNARYDMKMSIYLEIPANAYIRTLAQGVTLGDSRKLVAAYKKTLAQGVKLSDILKPEASYKKTLAMNGRNNAGLGHTSSYKRVSVMDGGNTSALGHGSSYVRKHTATVKGTGLASRAAGIYRKLAQQLKAGDLLKGSRALLRKAVDTVKTTTAQSRFVGNKRSIIETGRSLDGGGSTKRGIFRVMLMTVRESDATGRAALLLRVLTGKAGVSDAVGHWGDYVRGMYAAAGSRAGTAHLGEYHREAFDTAGTTGEALRSLGVFIRLATVGFVRDFLLRRFLKSNEELVLKSAICREIVLESRIH
ncbi:hypothetical protein TREPR_2049 [Treponema primitia ZAS-2]|uniref:Uncharacterized protein n=2 Tax=Treponema primitia TaxID=88058 RepID=F5YJT6_TREPZ|nr:hypothetical protein TREPR_2049 [Treponema primitia ZAS-2]